MVKVATIINTHGLKGECKLYLFTDDVNACFSKNQMLYLSDGKKMKVLGFRMQKGFGYAKFEGIDSIDQAELLKTEVLYINEKELPELEEDEFYYHELMGCTVFNEKKEELGNVVDILETGANLVLRIKKGKDSFLMPFVDAFVLDVDIEGKMMTIKEMEGLR
ncbi:MAG: 16S rRNA processing protein RimM [Holdemanella sp.]|nr:16S rRNA processing protein RimM [Holdemanella sp.]